MRFEFGSMKFILGSITDRKLFLRDRRASWVSSAFIDSSIPSETEEVLKAQNEPSKIGVESKIDSPVLILLNLNRYDDKWDPGVEVFLPQIAPIFSSLTNLEIAILIESFWEIESTSVMMKNSVSISSIARLTALDFPGYSNLSTLHLISPAFELNTSRAISPVRSIDPESITRILILECG